MSKLSLFYGGPFTLPTVCLIAIKILKKLKSLHSIGFLHNDLKPSNLCWGKFHNVKLSDINDIFLIDFDLCTKYRFLNVDKNDIIKKNIIEVFIMKILMIQNYIEI